MSDKGWFDQIMLSTNYRMNPKIARFISDVFYDGTLIVGNKNPETPDTFNVIDLGKNSGRAETLTVSENGRSTPSWANVISATKAVSRIRDIIERNGYAQKDVLVVTPYRGQKQVYTQVLKDSGLDGVRVSTIDAVQGDEAKAVVFDPVLVGTEQKSFLTKNRLLVALSRAQESLTVIGDIKGWATAKDPDVAAVFAALRKVTSSAVGGIDLSARDDMASVTPLRDIDVALPKDFEGFSYALKEPGYD
jgi:superfamily I DNA and/or RNA helicase